MQTAHEPAASPSRAAAPNRHAPRRGRPRPASRAPAARAAALLAALALGAGSATAATVHLADIVADPVGVMDFEDLPDFINGSLGHSAQGIRIQQVDGEPGLGIWTDSGLGNGRAWYPNGGDEGWTRITRVGGEPFEAVSFFGGSGWNESPQTLYFELADDDVVVLSGTLDATFFGSWFGFAGGDFDEVRLRASQGVVTGLDDCPSGGPGPNNGCNLAWLDDIRIGAARALPSPSTAWLLLPAVLAAAATARRRPRHDGAT